MKNLLTILFGILVVNFLQAQNTILGTWETADNSMVLEILEQEGEKYAQIKSVSFSNNKEDITCKKCSDERKGKSLLGMQVMEKFELNGTKWKVLFLDIKTGKESKVSLWVENKNVLKIKNGLFKARKFYRTYESSIVHQQLETIEDSISYAMGIAFGHFVTNDDLPIKISSFSDGFKDVLNPNKEAIFTLQQAELILNQYREKSKYEKQFDSSDYDHSYDYDDEEEVEIDEAYKLENETFLEENAKRSEIIVTESGLQYEILKSGTVQGAKPTINNKVEVHYVGTLIDGTEFDNSRQRRSPMIFPLNAVIEGFREALMLMQVGDIYKIYIPQELGYGTREIGPFIKPCSTLIYEIELFNIE